MNYIYRLDAAIQNDYKPKDTKKIKEMNCCCL